MPLLETLRLAWADPDIRQRIRFVLMVFAVFVLGTHVPVPGIDAAIVAEQLRNSALFGLIDTFGGGGLRRVSIFALGLNPYITASIIMQIMTTAIPQWKKELQEGGEYARRQQNRRTRLLTILLCFGQGYGFVALFSKVNAFYSPGLLAQISVLIFWTAGSMYLLWLGEQISEKGIGNGVSLMIFAGIVISLPGLGQLVWENVLNGNVAWWSVLLLIGLFLGTTWVIVFFTIAQRRIPIQHMRRQLGTKMIGGTSSYLPLSLNLAGVIPIIFAISLIYLPNQFASYFPANSPIAEALHNLGAFMSPNFTNWQGWLGALVYTGLIFFFTYFYTAVQYNVEDIANNLKRGGSFIPGVRPGKQTKDFLNAVISRITLVGAFFLAIVAITQFIIPLIVPVQQLSLLGGTSLLIMVSVALETMRQIEANILMKQYGG
jgi:preprotein translocase subunit SecY